VHPPFFNSERIAAEIPAEVVACLAAFSLRASAIIFDIRMGPPGEFLRVGREASKPCSTNSHENDSQFPTTF